MEGAQSSLNLILNDLCKRMGGLAPSEWSWGEVDGRGVDGQFSVLLMLFDSHCSSRDLVSKVL